MPASSCQSVMLLVFLWKKYHKRVHECDLTFGGIDSQSNSKSHWGHRSSQKSLTITLKIIAKHTDSHEISPQAWEREENFRTLLHWTQVWIATLIIIWILAVSLVGKMPFKTLKGEIRKTTVGKGHFFYDKMCFSKENFMSKFTLTYILFRHIYQTFTLCCRVRHYFV